MNFDFERLRAYLIAKREFYGADTPIGHRCSNVIELWQNRRNATGEQLVQIEQKTPLKSLGEVSHQPFNSRLER